MSVACASSMKASKLAPTRLVRLPRSKLARMALLALFKRPRLTARGLNTMRKHPRLTRAAIVSARKAPSAIRIGLIVGGLLGLAAGLRWQLQRFFTSQPRYRVEATLGPVEIRRYEATSRAETIVDAESWGRALREGFGRLNTYIFGDNTTHALVATTTPHAPPTERLTMSAPVTQTLAGPFTTSFVLPAGRTLGSLPSPNDGRVRLRAIPSRRMAALRFSGGRSASKVAAKARELLATLERAGMRTTGEVEFAGYDPPFTLAPLRRNEVLVELASY